MVGNRHKNPGFFLNIMTGPFLAGRDLCPPPINKMPMPGDVRAAHAMVLGQ